MDVCVTLGSGWWMTKIEAERRSSWERSNKCGWSELVTDRLSCEMESVCGLISFLPKPYQLGRSPLSSHSQCWILNGDLGAARRGCPLLGVER